MTKSYNIKYYFVVFCHSYLLEIAIYAITISIWYELSTLEEISNARFNLAK